MTAEPIIRVDELCKSFQIVRRRAGMLGALKNLFAPEHQMVRAVDGVSFRLAQGEMVGYLGPNGAGKSTTIKMLTGLLVPTGGIVEVDGFVPWKDRSRYVAHIGAVFGQRTTLWWDLPVIDSFELIQPMYRVPKDRFRRSLDEFVDVLEMTPFLYTPVRALSLGQRMRADLCAALLHEPRLVFLDEPTIGLDVVAKERIREFIQHVHRERGVTVLLTTHDLSDVERLCERVMILDHGRLLYDGSLAELNRRFESDWSLVVTLDDGATVDVDLSLPGLDTPQREGSQVIYHFDHRKTAAAELIQHLLPRLPVADIEVRRPAVEETIRRIYEDKLLVGEEINRKGREER
jgi:ABC-2 type transport system ATP-binding protein